MADQPAVGAQGRRSRGIAVSGSRIRPRVTFHKLDRGEIAMTPNPFDHLLVQMRGLLKTEAKMGPEDRKRFSWYIRADLSEHHHCTVIKGGANTCILQLDDVREEPAYPQDVLKRLQDLRDQRFTWFQVRWDGRVQSEHLELKAALTIRARQGGEILGMECGRPTTHYQAQRDLRNAFVWRKRT